MKSAVLLVVALTSAASADTLKEKFAKQPDPATEEPDEIADQSAQEANLESNAPREGFVFASALGFGVMMGGNIGVGRGPALSLRLGHVATQRTVLTFELDVTSAFHKEAIMGTTLTDSVGGIFAGAQRYTSARSSVWVRGAGGLSVFSPDIGKPGGAPKPTPGLGGLVGAGFDLARWGYLVLGFETFAMGSVSSDGFKMQLGFCTNLSYY